MSEPSPVPSNFSPLTVTKLPKRNSDQSKPSPVSGGRTNEHSGFKTEKIRLEKKAARPCSEPQVPQGISKVHSNRKIRVVRVSKQQQASSWRVCVCWRWSFWRSDLLKYAGNYFNRRHFGKFVLVTSCWVHVRATEDHRGILSLMGLAALEPFPRQPWRFRDV